MERAQYRELVAVVRVIVRDLMRRWPAHKLGEHDEDDLVQILVSRLWQSYSQRRSSYDPKKGTLRAYFYRSCRHELLSLVRKNLRRRRLFLVRSAELELGRPTTPEEWFEGQQRQDRLIEYLARVCPPEEQQLFFWAFVEQLDNAEVAEKMGLTLAKISMRKHHLREKIREFLGAESDRRNSL